MVELVPDPIVALLAGGLAALAVLLLSGGGTATARLMRLGRVVRVPADDAPGDPRGTRRGARGLPDPEEAAIAVVDRCAELLRAGVPPVRALSQISGLGTDTGLAAALVRIARALELGEPPHAAIRRHSSGADPRVAQVLDGMAAVWLVAESSGAPAAEMLAEYGNSCRLQADSRRERDVALAGPQSTVRVLTWLPVISLGLSLLIGSNPLRLLMTPMGLVTLTAGVALLAAGRMWMGALLRAAQ